MNKAAIMVVAHNRLPFLYVTLASIYKMKKIEDYPVYVFVDKVSDGLRKGLENTLSEFPDINIIFRPQRLRVRWNMLLGMKDLFEKGFENVIYFEDDFIIRSDTLLKIEETKIDSTAFVLRLSTWPTIPGDYCVLGNMISKDNFVLLYEWVRDRKFIGERLPAGNMLVYMDGDDNPFVYQMANYTCDHLMGTFLNVFNMKTQYIGEPLVAHFGVIGMNYGKIEQCVGNGYLLSDLGYILYTMFSGDRTQWLGNVANIFNDQKIPQSLLRTFCPNEFRYF